MATLPRRLRARNLARAAVIGLLALGGVTGGCAPAKQRKPIEMAPIGTVPIATRTAEETDGGTTTTPNSGTPSPAKEAACTSEEFESLDDILKQCDARMPRVGEVPSGMREKLEVKVTSAVPSIAPGGHVDLTVTLKNKSSEPLPLYFTGDPLPRFETETVDAKGRRVDLPTGKPPKAPSAPTRDVKVARITLSPGGTARVKIAWEAVKFRWAPEKLKGWDGRGFPRAANGPLAAGKYTLRIVLPLIGVFEKGELEVPRLPMDVGSTT